MTPDPPRPSKPRDIDGVGAAAAQGDIGGEVRAVRTSAALARMPHLAVCKVEGTGAFDLLDRAIPASLFVRDGQLAHTLLLHDDGRTWADLYVGNDGDDYLVVADGVSSDDLVAYLADCMPGGTDVSVHSLGESHSVLSLQGPYSWELLARIDGPSVIGFPYLSFFRPAPDRICMRVGQTGEFGYEIVIERSKLEAYVAAVKSEGIAFDLREVSLEAISHCSMENWFFDVRREGRLGLTPVELQLQWRLSADKDYRGRAAIDRRRSETPRRLTGFFAASLVKPGAEVFLERECVGTVVACEQSHMTSLVFGSLLLDQRIAWSGITGLAVRDGADSISLRTTSPPFTNNLSLYVSPQRHSYSARDEVIFPGFARSLTE